MIGKTQCRCANPCADVHTLPDTEGRADLHAVPDVHTMAYVDTDTCAYCHGDTDADTDCDSANTDAGCDSNGSTNADPDSDPANTDACPYCYSYTYANSDCDPADGDTGSDGYGSTDPDTDPDPLSAQFHDKLDADALMAALDEALQVSELMRMVAGTGRSAKAEAFARELLDRARSSRIRSMPGTLSG